MIFFRKKTEHVLMHANIPVIKGIYSFSQHGFREITCIYNSEHLPLGTIKNNQLSLKRLNHWIRWRGIPQYRVGLLQLESRLEIHDPLELLEREYSLSVSDTYWLKNVDDNTEWDDINFFHRSFDQNGFGQAMFSSLNKQAGHYARHTPNNTTCGYHRKAWFRRGNDLYLLKGGSPFYQQEPINEWLASQIAESLSIDAVHYDVEIYENNIVSVCKAMTNDHTDLVTAGDVLNVENFSSEQFQYAHYVKLLQKHGIENVAEKISDMLVMDYLLMNSDRHNQNHGILVDSSTMKWLDIAPVFDTGTGLGCLVTDNEILSQETQNNCELFNAKHFSHELLLQYINFKKYDLSSLNSLPRLYGEKLVQYQQLSGISNNRIENAYRLFYRRINRLKKAAMMQNH